MNHYKFLIIHFEAKYIQGNDVIAVNYFTLSDP